MVPNYAITKKMSTWLADGKEHLLLSLNDHTMLDYFFSGPELTIIPPVCTSFL